MIAGVSTACLYPAILEEALSDLTESGVKNTEIFFNTHCELESGYVKLIKNILHESNAACVSVHPYTCPMEPIMFFSSYERRVNDAIDYYKYYFDAMNMIGAKILVFHGNKNLTPIKNELYFERFARLAEAAKKSGITVAQENVSRCQSRSLDFLKQMSDYLGELACFVLDVKQAIRSNESPYDIVKEVGKKIVHVHLSDNGEKGDCLPIGKGNFDIKLFLSMLREKGFDGSVMLELYRHNYSDVSELAENYRHISRIISEI